MAKKTIKQYGTAANGAAEVYEGKVVVEALKRAGNNKNLHGHVHEILYKDAHNINPVNIIKGSKATLTKSATAVRDDIVIMKAGKVVGRAQLKDTAKSVGKTVQQAAKGKYAGTKLVGTKETVKAYNVQVAKSASKGAAVSQKMTSSGISSNTTNRIASKALGKSATRKAITSGAGSAALAGGAVSGVIEGVVSGKALIDGEIDGGEFAIRVAKETAGGSIAGYTGSVAATVATTAAAGVLATTTAPIWAPAAVGVAAAVVVGSGVKTVFDAIFDF